jgi:RES domain-containing protein
MLQGADLTAALSKIKRVAVHGPWYRIVPFRYLITTPPTPLFAAGSKFSGARFTPPGSFDSLYMATDEITALAEVNALLIQPGGPVSIMKEPNTILSVDGIITRVIDLTAPASQTMLSTNGQEMTGNWFAVPNPPTQTLAQAAYDLGDVAGIQYGSAKNPGQKNLAVFTDRLGPPAPDYLEVHDPHGNLTVRIGN